MSRLAFAILLAALAIRLLLLPLTKGSDFDAFHRLAGLALHGHNVYALGRHHGRPQWDYFPLCLDLFTALRWPNGHTGWSFRVLGKLPIVAADLLVGWLLYTALRRRGRSECVAVLGMALYLFNPLVLYNGAFYGRFDAIALAFLLLALEQYGTRWFTLAYALAIAAKVYPIFLLPLLVLGRDRQAPRRLIMAGGLVLALSLPYVVTDPGGLLDKLLHHTHDRALGRLSWYSLPLHQHWLSRVQVHSLAHASTLLYPVALLLVWRRPLYVKAAVCFALFVAMAQTVYEQYLLWALPFLIVVGLHERSRLALGLFGLFTVAGLLENEQTFTPQSFLHYALVPTPWPPLNAALALAIAVFVGAQVACGRPGAAGDRPFVDEAA